LYCNCLRSECTVIFPYFHILPEIQRSCLHIPALSQGAPAHYWTEMYSAFVVWDVLGLHGPRCSRPFTTLVTPSTINLGHPYAKTDQLYLDWLYLFCLYASNIIFSCVTGSIVPWAVYTPFPLYGSNIIFSCATRSTIPWTECTLDPLYPVFPLH